MAVIVHMGTRSGRLPVDETRDAMVSKTPRFELCAPAEGGLERASGTANSRERTDGQK
jgi:hypothetical protein